jgi:hypothetical protein
MVFPEDGRPGCGDAAEVAAGLVPVAQLLGHGAEIEEDREQQRMIVAKPPLAGRESAFEGATGRRRVPGLAVQPRKMVRRGEDLGVGLTEGRAGNLQGVAKECARCIDLARIAQYVRLVLCIGERRRLRHSDMLPNRCAARYRSVG